MSDPLLQNLNTSQRAAVSSPAQTLAILAGPGSGKTHTLTSRTAWLLQRENLQPWNVIVATFTVKAAREMKERIGKLIGNGLEGKLILGTFHSISRRYLVRYGHLIDIPKDFGIADTADSTAIIKRIVKRKGLGIKPAVARSRISSRKAKGDKYVATKPKDQMAILEKQEFDICFEEYQETLKTSNMLDYDDLLLRCVDLLRRFPSCVSNIEAVLIDEFQDTNLVQFDLMRLFAAQRKKVTIVGDPDQSIYGFRSAETKNFGRMYRQYPDTITIPLEENYRSSGAILLSALEVIQQDSARIAKSLQATHNVGTRPVFRRLFDAEQEASWLVSEIERCIGMSGGVIGHDDIAILLRSASLSRHIEIALGNSGIPYRMVGGHRFFDRTEIKIILDYMRVIYQPSNNDAVARVINIPSRKIGETTVKALLEEAEQSGKTLWKLVLDHCQGTKDTKVKFNKPTEQGLRNFVDIILTAQEKIADPEDTEMTITGLIDYIIAKTSFYDFLEKTYGEEHEGRRANIDELYTQATDFSGALEKGSVDEDLPLIDGLDQSDISTPLSQFLANIALASEVKAESEETKAQVTISTIHAAKGLEWPAVFIPAAYQGSIPHSRAEDTDEERRLLYVAMTRAKALLYLSCPQNDSHHQETTASPFLPSELLKPYFAALGPKLTFTTIQSISHILRRTVPTPLMIYESSQKLKSLEDDQFPVDGSNKKKYGNELGRDHVYSRGQSSPKRRRIGLGGEGKLQAAADWRPYATTMDKVEQFTANRVGFMSAGKLEIMSENDYSKSASAISDGNLIENGTRKEKKVPTRSTKRGAGQMSIAAAFNRSKSPDKAPVPAVPPTFQRTESAPVRKATNNIRSLERVPSLPPLSRPVEAPQPSIEPLHTSHRLGAGVRFNRPRPIPREEAPHSHYGSLKIGGSSPPLPETLINDAETENIPQLPPPEIKERAMRPAQTTHITSMQKLAMKPANKAYGVRRVVGGYTGGKFKPPTMKKPE